MSEIQEQVEQWDVLVGLRRYAENHVLLIGKPGSGKSTSLERLLWEEANAALQDPTARIPVFIKLRRCTATVEELIQNFFSSHRLSLKTVDIRKLLQKGKLLLLLDGLNELPDTFATEIANFRDLYRNTTPMIFSTRDLNIGRTLGITTTLRMLPLTEPKMRSFVRGYLGQEGEQLLHKLKDDHLRKFSETPLLLWMLCRVFAQSGQVPSNLGLAFREFAQLHDKQLQADSPVRSREQWSKILRHLSFSLMQGDDPTELRLSMPREEAENELTNLLQAEGRLNARELAERWLRDLLNYHLIQTARQPNLSEHIEFRHQLIQEYYAAEYLLKSLPKLSDEQLKCDYLNLLKWTEPITLTVALLNNKKQALRLIRLATYSVDVMLGARLVGEVSPEFMVDALQILQGSTWPLEIKIYLLGLTRSNNALNTLSSLLIDEGKYSPCLRSEIAKAMGKIGSKRAVTKLFESFKEEVNLSTRKAIVGALENVGSDQAVWGFLEILECEDIDHYKLDAQCRAINSLGRIGSTKSVERLLQALTGEEPDISWRAAIALGKIGSEESVSGLLEASRCSKRFVRWRAIDALCKISPNCAYVRLCELTRTSSMLTCIKAAEYLGNLEVANSKEESIAVLKRALEDKNSKIRMRAAVAIGKTNAKEVAESLERLVESEKNEKVRGNAITALGLLKSEESVDILLRILRKDFISNRKRAAKALDRIGSEKSVDGLLDALTDCDSDVRARAATALGNICSPRAINGLTETTKDRNHRVRKCVAKALSKIDARIVEQQMIDAEIDSDQDIQVSLALGTASDEAYIPLIVEALSHEDSRIQKDAITVIGRIGSDSTAIHLIKYLRDADSDIRVRLLNSLRKIASPSIVKRLYEEALRADETDILQIITSIQSQCKFYNYEIAHLC